MDDVVQDVFLRMQRGLAGLRDEERFGAWVYQVARSAIVDHQRRAREAPRGRRGSPEEEAPEINEDDRAVESELASYVAPFVAMLPSPYREALTLTELEGLTQKEAADDARHLAVGHEVPRAAGPAAAPQGARGLLPHRARRARAGRVVRATADGRLPDSCCTQPPVIGKTTRVRLNARGSSRYSPESDST